MFGKEYVAQHILQTIKTEQEEKLYRAYVTDTLQIIAENTAIAANKFLDDPVGKVMTRRWADFDKPAPQEETRTAEEIIDHIRKKLAA